MPTAPNRACSSCGKACPPSELRNGRCGECAKPVDAAADRYRANDPVRQLYLKPQFGWRKFRNHIIACNPICQRLYTNPITFAQEQCTAPATEVHHLLSPRTHRDLFRVAANVVALCRHHHDKAAGEPEGSGQRDPEKYVSTRAGFAMTGGVKEVN